MIIASEVMPGIVWNVNRVYDGNAPEAIEMETENEFIRSFNPVVLSNGLTGKKLLHGYMDAYRPPAGKYRADVVRRRNGRLSRADHVLMEERKWKSFIKA